MLCDDYAAPFFEDDQIFLLFEASFSVPLSLLPLGSIFHRFHLFFSRIFCICFPPLPHSLFLLSFVAFTVMVKIFRRGPGCTEGLSEEPKCSDAFVLLGNSRCPRCPGVLGQLGVSEPNWGSQNSFAQIPGKPNMFWLDCESSEFKDNICSVLSPPCVVKLTPASLADIGVGMPTGME